jgi:hypothetical protein
MNRIYADLPSTTDAAVEHIAEVLAVSAKFDVATHRIPPRKIAHTTNDWIAYHCQLPSPILLDESVMLTPAAMAAPISR